MHCIIMFLLSVLTSINAVVRIITAAILDANTILVTITNITSHQSLITGNVRWWTTCRYACAPSISTLGIQKKQQNMK